MQQNKSLDSLKSENTNKSHAFALQFTAHLPTVNRWKFLRNKSSSKFHDQVLYWKKQLAFSIYNTDDIQENFKCGP